MRNFFFPLSNSDLEKFGDEEGDIAAPPVCVFRLCHHIPVNGDGRLCGTFNVIPARLWNHNYPPPLRQLTASIGEQTALCVSDNKVG